MSKEVEAIIINGLDRLGDKVDKIEDSIGEVKQKVVLIEERQAVNREEHKVHESVSNGFKDALDAHIAVDNQTQTQIFNELKNYNELLDIHIAGVNTLKELHAQNAEKINLYKKEMDVRLGILEAPSKAKAYLYKKYMKIAGIITITTSVIGGITKVIGLW